MKDPVHTGGGLVNTPGRVQRLWAQIERIMKVNQIQVVTKEVVDAARDHLVIGTV